MKKFKFKTDLKFKLTIVVLSLLMLIGVLSYSFTKENFYITSTIIGGFSIITVIISIIGFIKSLKVLKETKSRKKLIYLIVRIIIICSFLYLVTVNLIDAINYIT